MSALIKYRPEIDGLRAIAVIAVIVFHLNANWLPGGFSGVEVFFALSGFLITSIIVREKELGQFSFKSFYVRRMKRILPPLYLMVAVVLVAGVFILTGKDYRYLKESIQYLVLFGSNIYFGKGGDYFAPQAAEMPLLHTWSLAVEEQFYFFWPVLLSLFYGVRRSWKTALFVVFVAASFVYAEYVLRALSNKPLAYYSLYSRYGEMLLGAGLALLCANVHSVLNSLSKRLSAASCILGLMLIGWSFVNLNEKSLFPGLSSLPAVVGTLLLIVGMGQEGGSIKRILSSKVFNHFGKLSYSLYLWHWPVLAYMRYIAGARELSISWIFVAVVMTYIFSFASYYLVEQIVRQKNLSFVRAFGFCLVIPTIAILGALRATNASSYLYDLDPKLTNYGGDEVCHLKFGSQCIRGASSKEPRVLIFGDSHAAHLHYFIDRLGNLSGWSAMLISASSCGPAFGFDVNTLPVEARESCKRLLDHVQGHVSEYDTVVLAGRWEFQFGVEPSEYGDPKFREKFENTLKILKDKGVRVILMSQVPSLTTDPARAEKALKLGVPVVVSYSSYYEKGNALIKEIADQYGVEVMDIGYLVKDLEGGFYLGGHSVYMDNNHLNQFGATRLAELYAKSPKAFSLGN